MYYGINMTPYFSAYDILSYNTSSTQKLCLRSNGSVSLKYSQHQSISFHFIPTLHHVPSQHNLEEVESTHNLRRSGNKHNKKNITIQQHIEALYQSIQAQTNNQLFHGSSNWGILRKSSPALQRCSTARNRNLSHSATSSSFPKLLVWQWINVEHVEQVSSSFPNWFKKQNF